MIQHRTRFAVLAAFAVALAMAAGAQAKSPARGGVSLDAQVSRLCVLGEPTPAGLALGQISERSGVRAGRLATIASQAIQLPGSFCNYAGAALAITASPLALTGGAAQSGFVGSVNYTCTIRAWGAAAATVRTSAASLSGDGVGAISAAPHATDLTLVVSDFAAADGLLQPGAYLALITITLGPDAGLIATGS